MQIDHEGLQVAYLDESGQIEYYLDRESGEVVELRHGDPRGEVEGAPARYARVPGRTVESEGEDRWAFLARVEDPHLHRQLSAAAEDPHRFREILASDRIIERAWYGFKNERASKAVDTWLRENGIG
jgi:hypothetical protein